MVLSNTNVDDYCFDIDSNVKSIIEIVYMGRGSMRVQWLTIRMVELVWRFIGIILHVGFIIRLKQGYEPENLI